MGLRFRDVPYSSGIEFQTDSVKDGSLFIGHFRNFKNNHDMSPVAA